MQAGYELIHSSLRPFIVATLLQVGDRLPRSSFLPLQSLLRQLHVPLHRFPRFRRSQHVQWHTCWCRGHFLYQMVGLHRFVTWLCYNKHISMFVFIGTCRCQNLSTSNFLAHLSVSSQAGICRCTPGSRAVNTVTFSVRASCKHRTTTVSDVFNRTKHLGGFVAIFCTYAASSILHVNIFRLQVLWEPMFSKQMMCLNYRVSVFNCP